MHAVQVCHTILPHVPEVPDDASRQLLVSHEPYLDTHLTTQHTLRPRFYHSNNLWCDCDEYLSLLVHPLLRICNVLTMHQQLALLPLTIWQMQFEMQLPLQWTTGPDWLWVRLDRSTLHSSVVEESCLYSILGPGVVPWLYTKTNPVRPLPETKQWFY